MAASDDPVRTLMVAAREGLLEYVGYTDAGFYEVRIVGATRQVPTDDVLPTVDRLRALDRLGTENGPVELLEVRPDGAYIFNIDGHRHTVAASEVCDWIEGYRAGNAMRPGERHTGESTLGAIREVLERPGISDVARMVILGLMYGGKTETSMDELREKVDRTKKTVVEALSFGNHLAPDLADRMIQAFGLNWRVTTDSETGVVDASGRPITPSEMPGITVLRLINEAEKAGLVRYVGEPSPNKARWMDRPAKMAVGSAVHTVDKASVAGWLHGLRAWYEQTGTVPPRSS